MKPFANRRVRCNTAFAMLLMWLFALASGVANACLLEARETHTPESSVTHLLKAGEVHGMSAAHAVAAETDHGGSGVSKAPCLKVCDDSSKSLVNQQSGFDQAGAAHAPLVAAAWVSAIPGDARLIQAASFRRPDPGPPIRVLFSRLAL